MCGICWYPLDGFCGVFCGGNPLESVGVMDLIQPLKPNQIELKLKLKVNSMEKNHAELE